MRIKIDSVSEGGIGFPIPLVSPPKGTLVAAHIKHVTAKYLHGEKSGPLWPSPHAAFPLTRSCMNPIVEVIRKLEAKAHSFSLEQATCFLMMFSALQCLF